MNTTNATNTRDDGLFRVVYKLINSKANSNAFIQGVSGVAGFPATVAVDGIVIFTHYEPMINDIRKIYGRNEISVKELSPMMGSLLKEIIADFALDKVLGHIPLAGAYFNAVAAKALTWRLGLLVAILSSRGDEITKENVSEVAKLVRYLTPLNKLLKLKRPDYEVFRQVVVSVSGDDPDKFNSKIQTALKAFE